MKTQDENKVDCLKNFRQICEILCTYALCTPSQKSYREKNNIQLNTVIVVKPALICILRHTFQTQYLIFLNKQQLKV